MTMSRFHVTLQGPALPMDDPTPVGRALLIVHGYTDVSVMQRPEACSISGAVEAGSLAEAVWQAHQIVVFDVLAAIFEIEWDPGVTQVNRLTDEPVEVLVAEDAEIVRMEEPEVWLTAAKIGAPGPTETVTVEEDGTVPGIDVGGPPSERHPEP